MTTPVTQVLPDDSTLYLNTFAADPEKGISSFSRSPPSEVVTLSRSKGARGSCRVGLNCLRPRSLPAAERQRRRCPGFNEHARSDGEPCGDVWSGPRDGPAG